MLLRSSNNLITPLGKEFEWIWFARHGQWTISLSIKLQKRYLWLTNMKQMSHHVHIWVIFYQSTGACNYNYMNQFDMELLITLSKFSIPHQHQFHCIINKCQHIINLRSWTIFFTQTLHCHKIGILLPYTITTFIDS